MCVCVLCRDQEGLATHLRGCEDAGEEIKLDLHQGNHRPSQNFVYAPGSQLSVHTARAGWFDAEADAQGRVAEDLAFANEHHGVFQVDLHQFNHCVRRMDRSVYDTARTAFMDSARADFLAFDALTRNDVDMRSQTLSACILVHIVRQNDRVYAKRAESGVDEYYLGTVNAVHLPGCTNDFATYDITYDDWPHDPVKSVSKKCIRTAGPDSLKIWNATTIAEEMA